MKKRILLIASFPPPVHGSAVVSQQIKESKLINDTFDCDYINLSTSRTMEEAGMLSFKKMWDLVNSLMSTFWKLLSCHYVL